MMPPTRPTLSGLTDTESPIVSVAVMLTWYVPSAKADPVSLMPSQSMRFTPRSTWST